MEEHEVVLEQYKLYVEMADKISERRAQANRFYISILSALLVIFSLISEKQLFESKQAVIIFTVSILGILLNILWIVNIRSYRQLNTAKFMIIHELEQKLPFAGYKKEWDVLGKGKNRNKYLQLTRVEQNLPILFIIPFLLILVIHLIDF